MNRAQLGLGEVFVMVMILILLVVGEGGKVAQAKQQEKAYDSLHRDPPRAATRILVAPESGVKRPAIPEQVSSDRLRFPMRY